MVRQSGDDDQRKLFVGGISRNTSDAEFGDHFASFGEIVDIVIIKDNNGESKGFGFVTYTNNEQTEQCVKGAPHVICGKTVEVKRAVPRDQSTDKNSQQKNNKIFIGGLNRELTNEDSIKSFFEQEYNCTVSEVNLIREKREDTPEGQEPRLRGFGFITIDDYDVVDRICIAKNHVIDGKSTESKKAAPREGGAGGRGGMGGGRGRGARGGFGGGQRGGYNQGGGGFNQGGGYGNQQQGGYGGNQQGGGGWGGNQGGGYGGGQQGGYGGGNQGGGYGGNQGGGYGGQQGGYQGGNQGGGGYQGGNQGGYQGGNQGGYQGGQQQGGYQGNQGGGDYNQGGAGGYQGGNQGGYGGGDQGSQGGYGGGYQQQQSGGPDKTRGGGGGAKNSYKPY